MGNSMDYLDNNQILVIASTNAEVKKPLKDIFQAWPNLLQITLRLVRFMGVIVPSDKNMLLLESCLLNAVNSFHDVTPIEYATEAQMVAYIKGLLMEVDQVAKVSVGTLHDDPVLWEPLTTDISEFQREHNGKIKVYDHPYSLVKPSSMRQMVLARIISMHDLAWIDKYTSLSELLGEAA